MALIKSKSKRKQKKISLITSSNPYSMISEQYRKIRTNFLSTENGLDSRTLVITSPNREEGKTTTVVNLAISLAQQGKKVLLIDADLRNPTIHNTFKIENTLGLSNILMGQKRLEDTIHFSEIKDLDLITSGPTPLNPAELLDSEQMSYLLERVLRDYDLVLFDTPSILEVADAKIVANQCDGLILVIRWGKTHSEDAMAAKKNLESANAKLLGVILNEKV